ncbi:uncharacterized protein G2W53_014548 [Senna tora]|uniref:Uncharacterized protein n=1 Tax=Senna tora TaxID=362788 RepID=A0A835C5V0_9FABA|nr:uncharacterized protein G2W53_014548 [Senna tora]
MANYMWSHVFGLRRRSGLKILVSEADH